MPDKSDLVARRQQYIQRQIALHREAVNVRFRGLAPRGTGGPNRHGMPKLPVGAHAFAVRRYPTVYDTPVLTLSMRTPDDLEYDRLNEGSLFVGDLRIGDLDAAGWGAAWQPAGRIWSRASSEPIEWLDPPGTAPPRLW